MNNKAMKEVLNDLFSHLERLETQSEAILQFLKEKKRVTDKQLAPYLEQAGNASNVKWRAARVRIDHLLSSEQPEKEAKLGKQPQVKEDSPSTEKRSESDAKEEKRVESVDEEGKRTGSGDQKQIESSDKDVKKNEPRKTEASDTDLSKKETPVPAEAVQARPADGGSDKPEKKSESSQEKKEQAPQAQSDQKSESVHHPTEVTEPLAQREGAEPAAQLKPKEKGSDQEAA
jgi:hypothetical protein